MLVKCRALASVTAAVGNKITILQTGALRVITTGVSPCIYFEFVVVLLSVYVQPNREGNQVATANMTMITVLSKNMNILSIYVKLYYKNSNLNTKERKYHCI